MRKLYLIYLLFYLLTFVEAMPQTLIQSNSISTYRSSTADKPSWQRLNLFLSSTYWHVIKEGQVDLNSSLLYASRSLGMSRLPILAEGIDDVGLLTQSQWVDQGDPDKGNQILLGSTGKQRLEMLILLGSYYAFEPQLNKRDSAEYFLTSAIKESNVLKNHKLRRHALCLLGKMFLDINNIQRGDSVFNSLIADCEASGDRKIAARAYEYWGLYSPFSPATTQDRINHLQKAADIYHNLDLLEGEINALTDIGYLHVASGRLQDAYGVFSNALALAESIKYPYLHYNTDAMAMVTAFQGKFGEPLKYTLQTIKAAESAHDSIGLGYFYGRLSGFYKMEGGREKESMTFLKKAYDRFLIDHNPALYALLYNLIGPMIGKGQSKEAHELITSVYEKIPPVNFTEMFWYYYVLSISYSGLHKFDSATIHLSKADSMETKAESFRGPLRKAMIYYQQGYIYLKQGQLLNARSSIEKYLSTYSPAARVLGNDIEALGTLIKIDSKLNDHASGMQHYKRYTMLLDSNYRVTKIRQAEELQVMYQTQEKESQIALLNQQAKVEQANLKQAILTRNMTISGIIATLIIAGLLYRQSRLRRKTNQVVTQKNQQLQHFLNEKEWLLKEIHHRVKNNLQIVMSLLNSQSAYIDNEPALIAIHDSQHRVHAMSLIHQKLYNTENVSSIEISPYIRELVSYLADSFRTGQRIRFEFAVDPLEMDVSQAVPLGLILNEAITNAIKYAFPDDRTGIISISLSSTSSDQYLLIISDNGIGISSNLIGKKKGSLGMSLMEGLSEDLDGNLAIENNNGTTIKISFIHDPSTKRPDSLEATFVSNNLDVKDE